MAESKVHGLGMVCVLQPEMFKGKKIHVLFQMHFKLIGSFAVVKVLKLTDQFLLL